MDNAAGNAAAIENTAVTEPHTSSTWVGWSSLFLAFVQSVCAAFAALSGLRLLIGAAAVQAGENSGRRLQHAAVVRSLRKLETRESPTQFQSQISVKLEGAWKQDNLAGIARQ
jgi:hypothetical protein